MVTWDEPKRRLNIEKHGIDFVGCDTLFDGPVITLEDDRLAYGEQRFNALGLWAGRVVNMTYTERGDDLHVISPRGATKHETRYFFSNIQP